MMLQALSTALLGGAPSLIDWGCCQKVYELMADETSRHCYKQELLWQSQKLIGCEETIVSPCSAEKYNQVLKTVRQRMRTGVGLPLLNGLKGRVSMEDTFACTFVLEQYRYKNIVECAKNDVFYDCGGFIGDTAVYAALHGAKVISFEPIKALYNLLCENCKEYEVTAVNCGVGNETSMMCMKVTTGIGSSHVHNNGGELVKIERIDDLAKKYGLPTFIKMDLEGYEPVALTGAAAVLEAAKPKLAVCLYHSIEHMWSVPMLLHQLVPEYRFYCKKSAPTHEFVLFAAAGEC